MDSANRADEEIDTDAEQVNDEDVPLPVAESPKPVNAQVLVSYRSQEDKTHHHLEFGLYNPTCGILVYTVDNDFVDEDHFRLRPDKIVYDSWEEKKIDSNSIVHKVGDTSNPYKSNRPSSKQGLSDELRKSIEERRKQKSRQE